MSHANTEPNANIFNHTTNFSSTFEWELQTTSIQAHFSYNWQPDTFSVPILSSAISMPLRLELISWEVLLAAEKPFRPIHLQRPILLVSPVHHQRTGANLEIMSGSVRPVHLHSLTQVHLQGFSLIIMEGIAATDVQVMLHRGPVGRGLLHV